MTATFELTATMKIDDCQRLHQFLDTAQDQPVIIDCKEITRLGGLAAQLLLMGQRQWSAAGHTFDLLHTSEAFRQCINDLGLVDDVVMEANP